MTRPKLVQLTELQKKELPKYIHKWRQISLNSEKITPNVARELIQDIFKSLGKKATQIKVFDRPLSFLAALADSRDLAQLNSDRIFYDLEVKKQLDGQLASELISLIQREIYLQLAAVLEYAYYENNLATRTIDRLVAPLENRLQFCWSWRSDGDEELWNIIEVIAEFITPDEFIYNCCYCDFCLNVLGCQCDLQKWQLLEKLGKYFLWIVLTDFECFLCLHFANEKL